MPSILFVCTANQFRSPFAALSLGKALLRNRPTGKWVVESAGTWAKGGLAPQSFMVKIAKDLGLQGLERHRSQQVNRKMMEQFDLIIVMELGHKEALRSEFQRSQKRIFLLSEIVEGVSYNITDPMTPDVNPVEIAEQIDRLVNKGFSRIIQAAEYFCQARRASSGKAPPA